MLAVRGLLKPGLLPGFQMLFSQHDPRATRWPAGDKASRLQFRVHPGAAIGLARLRKLGADMGEQEEIAPLARARFARFPGVIAAHANVEDGARRLHFDAQPSSASMSANLIERQRSQAVEGGRFF